MNLLPASGKAQSSLSADVNIPSVGRRLATAPHMDVFETAGIGSDFLGYRIEDLIGRGGMASSTGLDDLRLKRPLALKVVAPGARARPAVPGPVPRASPRTARPRWTTPTSC